VALDPADYYARYLGFDDVGVFQTIAHDQDWDLSEDTLMNLIRAKGQLFDELVNSGDTLFPGAASCIRTIAAEFPIAIASGALASEIETVLATTNLRQHIRAIVASGDTPRSKPEPDPYLRALELLRPYVKTGGHNPNGCFVAIEDSRWGIESAVKAGLRCIGIAQTYPATALEAAHLVLPTIADVTLDTLHKVCAEPKLPARRRPGSMR
jgi:beta-phosphoglucomutase-like phosphatase (HAD superfamily)